MSRQSKYRPLERRIFKKKNPVTRFFCPLCSTERSLSTNPRLSIKNYIQLTSSTVFIGLVFFPLMGFRSIYLFFVFWACFELVVRLRFRKEIPCPHCGFDASWYKRDVTVARKFVEEFWAKKNETENVNKEALAVGAEVPIVGVNTVDEYSNSSNIDL